MFLASVIDTSGTAYSASFQYALAPGLALMGGMTHYSIKNGDYVGFADAVLDANGRANNKATTYTLSTQVSFLALPQVLQLERPVQMSALGHLRSS